MVSVQRAIDTPAKLLDPFGSHPLGAAAKCEAALAHVVLTRERVIVVHHPVVIRGGDDHGCAPRGVGLHVPPVHGQLHLCWDVHGVQQPLLVGDSVHPAARGPARLLGGLQRLDDRRIAAEKAGDGHRRHRTAGGIGLLDGELCGELVGHADVLVGGVGQHRPGVRLRGGYDTVASPETHGSRAVPGSPAVAHGSIERPLDLLPPGTRIVRA